MKYIASVSFGKDSAAMLSLLIKKNWPLDEVVFYDTGMEFQAIYDTRDRFLPLLNEQGIKYTELKPGVPFLYKMFEKPVNGPNGPHCGYSWCGGRCRWGTTEKLKALEGYCKGAVEYIGIAADEEKRLIKERKGHKVFPLAEMGMKERDCRRYCYKIGIYWVEDAGAGKKRLYNVLSRVSCWCCGNKNLKELRLMRKLLPKYWERLKELQSRTDRPMKGAGKSVFDLETRFEREESNE